MGPAPQGNGGGARPSLLASQRPRMGMGGSKYGANPTTATIVRNPSSYGRADSRDRSPPRSLDRVASASDGGQWRGDEREEGEAGEVRTRRDSRGDSRFGGGGGGWDKPQPPAPAPAPAADARGDAPTEEGELPPAPAPAPIARQASAPAATAATPEESPAPAKRKKLGWGQGLARGKSLPTPPAGAGAGAGGDDRIPTPSLDGQPPLPFGPPPGTTGGGPGLDGGSSNPYDYLLLSRRREPNAAVAVRRAAAGRAQARSFYRRGHPQRRRRLRAVAVGAQRGLSPGQRGRRRGGGGGLGGAVDPIARAAVRQGGQGRSRGEERDDARHRAQEGVHTREDGGDRRRDRRLRARHRGERG